MGKWCPITNSTVVYLECIECEDKPCKNESSSNNQSNTNITIQTQKERN